MIAGNFLYRFRTFLSVPFVIFLIIVSRFSLFCFIIALLLISAGLVLRIYAKGYGEEWMRGSEFSADFLLKRGPFSVIRHPLYAGNFFIGLGFTVISSFKLHLLVPLYLIIFTVYYGLIIIAEEEYLEEEFGREYRDYGNRVPSFFPDFSLFRKGNFDLEFALADERDTALTVLTVILIFSIKFLITHSPSLLTKVQLLLLIASR